MVGAMPTVVFAFVALGLFGPQLAVVVVAGLQAWAPWLFR